MIGGNRDAVCGSTDSALHIDDLILPPALDYDEFLADLDHSGQGGLALDILRGMRSAIEQATLSTRSAAVDDDADLLTWCRNYLPHYFTTATSSAMHAWLAAHLDSARSNRGARVNVIGPRGNAKSTVAAEAYVLRCALDGTEPLIWIISETSDQAENRLDNIKQELESNITIAADYPRAAGKGPLWRKEKIRLKNNTVIEAYGTGQKLRGRRSGSRRPSLIVLDDIQSEAVMVSAERRKKDRTWLAGAVLKAGDRRTNVVNLATALHRDAIGIELCRAPGWEAKVFPAIVAWPANMELWERWESIYHDIEAADHKQKARDFYEANREAMDAGAVVLWPEWESLYDLMVIRATEGRSEFEREKQGRPINPDDCEWPESYFDDGSEASVWFDEWPCSADVKVLALDPSKGKDARRSDYSAFVRLLVRDGIYYVDADLQRRPVAQIVADGVEHWREFQPNELVVESNAWQDLIGEQLNAALVAQGIYGAPLILLNNTQNKTIRIRRLGGKLAQRRIRFKRGSPGALLLVAQMKDFPDPHSHDDGPDALEMAVRVADGLLSGGSIEGAGGGRGGDTEYARVI